MFSLRELRRLEDERVATEVADEDRRRRAAEAAAAEAARAAERAVEERRAREDSERHARDLAEGIARIEAELSTEREAHAASRAQSELALAQLRAATGAHVDTNPRIHVDARRWPLWLAILGLAASIAFATLWLDARIASARHASVASTSASMTTLSSELDLRFSALSIRVEEIERIAKDAAAAATKPSPSSSPPPSTPRPRPPRATGTTKPPADPTPAPIKPCGTTSPLGCLHH